MSSLLDAYSGNLQDGIGTWSGGAHLICIMPTTFDMGGGLRVCICFEGPTSFSIRLSLN